MCTYAVKPCNYEVFARTAQKWAFLSFLGGVVTIATVIYIKLLLQKCEKFICMYHDRRLKSYKFFVLSNFGFNFDR